VTPRRLTPERVLYAGMEVVEQHGVDALDLIAVARRLHVLPTTLQRFMTQERIRALVLGEIVASVPTLSKGTNWRWRLESWARRTREWLARYPGLARHLSTTCMEHDETLAVLDSMVDVMTRVGVPARERFNLAHGFFCFVLERVANERQVSAGTDPLTWARVQLRAEELTHLAASVDAHVVGDPVAHFQFSVRALIEGIAHQAEQRRPAQTAGVNDGDAKRLSAVH
jgi:Tetracyclin repressor-like, C-terminal domain